MAVVRNRAQAYLRDAANIAVRLPDSPSAQAVLGVGSDYFFSESQVVLGRVERRAQTLVLRHGGGRFQRGPDADRTLPTTIVWLRQD